MSEKTDRQKIRMFVQEVTTLVQYKSFKLIDELLVKAINKLPESSPLKMITYARATSAYKSELPHWNDFVKSIQIELDKRNIDSKKELVGLL